MKSEISQLAKSVQELTSAYKSRVSAANIKLPQKASPTPPQISRAENHADTHADTHTEPHADTHAETHAASQANERQAQAERHRLFMQQMKARFHH